MGNIGKTAAEIAAELHITRQAVYKRLRVDRDLQSSLHGLTVEVNNRIYYPPRAESILKAAFVNHIANLGSQNGSQAVDSDLQNSEPNLQEVDSDLQNSEPGETATQALYTVIDELRHQLDTLRAENAAQREQATAKDTQIAALQTHIDSQAETIQQQHKTIENLTAAVTAAQALHAADIKQIMQRSEDQAAEPAEPRTLRERFRAWRDRKKQSKGE